MKKKALLTAVLLSTTTAVASAAPSVVTNYLGVFIGEAYNNTIRPNTQSVLLVGDNQTVDGKNVIMNGIGNTTTSDNSITSG